MAVRSLWQGVCVFDANQRLVICNDAYLRMYGLTREQATPGTTLLEILQQRIGQGLFSGASPQDYIRERFGYRPPAVRPSTRTRSPMAA
jgi:PAS domain-containing protein